MLAVAAVGAVVLSLSIGPGAAGAAPAPSAAPGASAKVPSLVRQLATRYTAAKAAGLSTAERRTLGDGLLAVDAGGLDLQLHATGAVGKAETAQLAALGVTVRSSSADFAAVPGADLPDVGLVHAVVPPDKLDAVAALPWVATVRPALKPQTDVGPVSSEGAVLHRADKANRLGITGRGQKVGAMSDGVTSLAASQAQGELPADVQVLDAGDGDEGTGMLEIVHDSAPGAKLAFSGTGETLEDHVGGLRALAAAGSTIITEDLAFDDEPAFQQGLTATTAERLALGGVFFSSSAGQPRRPAHAAGPRGRHRHDAGRGGPGCLRRPVRGRSAQRGRRRRRHRHVVRLPARHAGACCSRRCSGASRGRSTRPSGRAGSPT